VGLGAEWHIVREAYRRITRVYERANILATLGNVNRWRREAVALFYSLNGKAALKVLDAGAGLGNMAKHIKGDRYVVALDATPEMLYVNDMADDKVVRLRDLLGDLRREPQQVVLQDQRPVGHFHVLSSDRPHVERKISFGSTNRVFGSNEPKRRRRSSKYGTNTPASIKTTNR
jgi:SAM-dependent methyltransferase